MKKPSILSRKFNFLFIITMLFWVIGIVHPASAQVPIPPTYPANGEIYPWGYQIKGTAWNTSQYLPFVYNTMPFRMLLPSGVTYNRTTNTFTNSTGEKLRVILFLHGSSVPGTDNGYQLSIGGKDFLEGANSGKFRGIIIFPQSPTSTWGATQRTNILGIVNRLLAKGLADPFAVSITGTSSGGSAVWDLLSLNPTVFSSCTPMSATSTLATSSISKYVHVPLWLAQGAYDGIARPSTANALVTSIQNAGGNIKYTYYSDIGHGTWDKFLLEPDLFLFFTRANKVNPHVFFGRTDFYSGDVINIKLGVTPGFEAYEWRKNGVPISGATTNGITVTQIGTYDVRIRRSGQWSYWSPSPVVVRIIPTTVAPPNGLTLGSATPTTIVLNWKDNASNETAYEIYRSVNGTTFTKIATKNANATNHTDNVSSKTSYYYKVLAINTYGASSFSNTLFVTTPNANPVISAAPLATVVEGTSSSLAVTATDTDDSSVTFGLLNNPSFVSIARTGAKTATLTIASSSTSKGVYPVSIAATDATGGYSTRNITITISDVAIISTYINFNNGTNVPLPWNNTAGAPTLNLTRTNLKDDKNVATGINLTLLTAWQGVTTTGTTTGNNSGIFPDDVMRTSYYEGGTSTKQIRFGGLSTAKLYNFIFFGSRSGTGDRTTLYTTGGQTVTMNTSENTSQTVQINGVKPSAAGEIIVQVKKGINANFADLNAMIIQSYPDSGIPNAPTELAVGTFSKNSLTLRWKDNSSSESGFELWRSETNIPTAFTRVATTTANATTFTNTNLLSDKIYYYKVRAIAASGALSPYSNTIAVSTLAYTVSLNFNDFVGAPAPWNNLNDALSIDSPPFNFKDNLGNSTGISLSVLDNFNGTNTSGMNTGNNSGVYPDAVMRGFNYLETGARAKLLIRGLNQQYRYHFNFFGSRSGTGDKTAQYTIGNNVVYLNASNNSAEIVQINNVTPQQDGTVLIDIYAPPTSTYAYLNAMVIQAFTASPSTQNQSEPTQPTTIAAVATEKEERSIEETEEVKLVVFPNPFDHKITLVFPHEINGDIDIELYEASGRKIRGSRIAMNSSVSAEIDFSDTSLNPGLHLIKVASPEGKVEMIKLMRK